MMMLIFNGAVDFVARFAGGLLELLDGLPEPLGQFGHFLAAKENEDDDQNENDLPAADAEKTQKCEVHIQSKTRPWKEPKPGHREGKGTKRKGPAWMPGPGETDR